MEIVPNLRPIVFWLKVRTRGPLPSICVPTFSQFTNRRPFKNGYLLCPFYHFMSSSVTRHPTHSRGRSRELPRSRDASFGTDDYAFFISASIDPAASDPVPGRWSSRPSPVRHQAPLYRPLA